MNIEKSNYVIFSSPQKKLNYNLNIVINNKLLEQKKGSKYLGIILDHQLNWKSHIQEILKKIVRGLGLLSRIRCFVNTNILVQLYYSLIYPYLTYGLITWGNTYQSAVHRLFILQKKSIRLITYSRFDEHTSPLFRRLDILKFNDLIFFQNA